MKRIIALILATLIFTCFLLSQNQTKEIEKEKVRQASFTYAQAYEQGNTDLIKKVLHPGIVKRGVYISAEKEPSLLEMDFNSLLTVVQRNSKRSEEEKNRDLNTRVDVHGISGNIANVTLADDLYVEYLSLIKVKGDWKIINVLWTNRK